MQPATLPLTRDIVLIGGGHTHALVLRMWGMKPLPGARLTLINPLPTAAYSGMLPGHIAGHYPREALQLDLVRLARHAGARLILGYAEGIDRENRLIHVPGRAPIAYDIASIDTGITAEMPDIPGFGAHVTPAKPLDAFADRWEAFATSAPPGPRIAVVGGGVAGVELALAFAHRRPDAHVSVYEAAPETLTALGRGARQRLRGHCARHGVRLVENARLTEARADGLRLSNGTFEPAEFILGTGATKPADWLPGTGLDLHEGFVSVGPTLQSSDPAIFAAGDIAHLAWAPRPKAGVYAVREAPVLFDNLRAAVSGRAMRSYRPQRDYLKLISTGDQRAVADKWGLPLDGAWLWRWKDRIDRRFMAMVADLPNMPPPALPPERAQGIEEVLGAKPLCGGCGGKLGAAALREVLADLPPPQRGDVRLGAGGDAAVLAHGSGVQMFTTDHVRAFCEDPWLLGRAVAIHALGDIWAAGGQPQAALAQVTLPRMAEGMAARSLAEILAAAGEVLRDAGADLVGGHTSLGAEVMLGFSITGLAERPVGQDGAEPGDALILTKPLGTGVILAAEMLKAAPGEIVAGAWASMATSSARAAAILAPVAHAMTDVTGFGLAGHLLGLCRASGVGAELALADIPLLPGAEALSVAGHGSSLLAQNIAACAGAIIAPPGPRTELLYDPQTAGGLLATVPQARAPEVIAALREAGYGAAAIGRIVAGAPLLRISG
ncbi:selenide, water dikinase SelD [Sinirhodobacter sp. WL0062]|uniref:Selenide, water dikinase SelD n=1 Tax=Rhodobacter flavimaris TaxID=2907145 RepID=A0ABS8YY85_9RHOB|nr:selenide, water dikinase SelD [Sinirhodobacter sp. WL0062]MCE5974453.1 selenide, water dikinase SelD [Sinirhodobacter sp. WL0062]